MQDNSRKLINYWLHLEARGKHRQANHPVRTNQIPKLTRSPSRGIIVESAGLQDQHASREDCSMDTSLVVPVVQELLYRRSWSVF